MTKDVDAIFENGAFRPVGAADIPLADGTRVRLSIELLEPAQNGDVLDLAASVYAGLSEQDIADVEQIATDRTAFFTR